jgi:hypothetical protein
MYTYQDLLLHASHSWNAWAISPEVVTAHGIVWSVITQVGVLAATVLAAGLVTLNRMPERH